ncbi:MAG TPA: carboxylesterase/lipase family protein [Thermodesulfobacteriota bacterium]|nr:carboxylesterase/lipase family protein [Thermodesulfobacteriota bacterium]
MNNLLRVSKTIILISFVLFGCAGKKPGAPSKTPPEAPQTPPIYQDTSDFEKPPCSTPEIKIRQGSVCGNLVGTSNGKAVNAYLGIPFAETTGGRNRWKAPVPKAAWDGALRATRLGPACPQDTTVMYPQSEECLSVNVWTPGEVSPFPRAVMVFIYGGAFIYGYNADPLYDGAYTAAYGDVVVVSMNYRLGALGFLSGIKDRKTGEEIKGNFGVLDQILALEWVRDNVGAFGGDPDKVTIYGESAGAMSVGLHLLSSPRSEPLFRAGIMESNPLGLPYKNLKQSRSIAGKFASNLGCPVDDVGCMRAALLEVVLDAQQQKDFIWPALFHGIRDMLVWAPVIDGEVLIEQPIEAAASGRLTKPVIIGTNANEALIFVELTKTALGWKTVSDFDYRLTMDFIFRDRGLREKIYDKYPPDGKDNTGLISNVLTDYLFTCPSLDAASHASREAWSYIFDHVPSFNVWPGVPACAEAVCHAAELSFVFHTPEGRRGKFTPQENALSNLMVGYWADFAKNLNPDGGANAWSEFNPASLNLVFVTPVKDIQAKPDTTSDCAFWDGVGYNLRDSFWGLF